MTTATATATTTAAATTARTTAATATATTTAVTATGTTTPAATATATTTAAATATKTAAATAITTPAARATARATHRTVNVDDAFCGGLKGSKQHRNPEKCRKTTKGKTAEFQWPQRYPASRSGLRHCRQTRQQLKKKGPQKNS